MPYLKFTLLLYGYRRMKTIMRTIKMKKRAQVKISSHFLNTRFSSIIKTTATMCILRNGSIIQWNLYTSANFQKFYKQRQKNFIYISEKPQLYN